MEQSTGHVRLRQDIDTPLTTLISPLGTLLYLYARSGDSVTHNTAGQDYLAFQHNKTDLVFAVCDGVGQSFMGDLAARLLGDAFVEWLATIKRPDGDQSFSDQVGQWLNDLTKTSAKQVADFQLPAHLPALVVQALEMQRDYGSEAMFVAGRLALGTKEPWLALCWLGDAPVAAIDIDGELVDLGPKGHTSERWNATTGAKGVVHTWVGGAENVARVAGYTDGLGVDTVPTDRDLAILLDRWAGEPPADDATLFDIRLAPSPETVGDSTPESLEKLAKELEQHPIVEAGEGPRPIPVEQDERTPVAGLAPIEAESEPTAVEGWRPLGEKAPAADKKSGIDAATRKQIEMWQEAALQGLTSAALAIVMVERLIKEQLGDRTD